MLEFLQVILEHQGGEQKEQNVPLPSSEANSRGILCGNLGHL
jgi:hypothetical protein